MTPACQCDRQLLPFELVPMVLDIARRRILWFVVPIVLGALVAASYVYTSPRVYTAGAQILMQPANQGSPLEQGTMRYNNTGPASQVQAIEAWMKSDTIIDELLQRLLDGPMPTSEEHKLIVRANLRRSLNFQLLGNSILLVTLDDSRKEGLAHKLEFVVTRLMDGLMRPNKGLLSGTQLILLHQQEAVSAARRNFTEAMQQSGQQEGAATLAALREVQTLIAQGRSAQRLDQAQPDARGERTPTTTTDPAASETPVTTPVTPAAAMARISKLADDLSLTPRQLLVLAELHAARLIAEAELRAAQDSYRDDGKSYMPIFAAPEKLAVMGRPRDPITGKIGGRKPAAMIVILSILFGGGIALLRELLDRRVRLTSEAVQAMGVPVIARVPRVGGGLR